MKTLGLDLGSASIGWALVEFDDNNNKVDLLGIGTRIVPYTKDTVAKDFKSGKGETACSERTRYRGMRRNLDRWQLHRDQLRDVLVKYGIFNGDESFEPLNPLDVWGLRADAARIDCRLSLVELARVLLHINHRRGYRHAKSDLSSDSKQTDYVARVNNLSAEIDSLGLTAGQYFYNKLKASESVTPRGKKCYTYRIKENVLTRRTYEREVHTILSAQQCHYPDILTDEALEEIFRVIFYQRPLKSCKHLVSKCEFEARKIVDANGKEIEVGPRVAPRSSPLAQVCRLYEAINNISLTNPRRTKIESNSTPSLFDAPESAAMRKYKYRYDINDEERRRIFDYMNTHGKLTGTELFKLLGLKKADGFRVDNLLSKGIKGNETYTAIRDALAGLPEEQRGELLRFNITVAERVDEATGEITEYITNDYARQPLHMLWHTVYSIDDRDELFAALRKNFGINDQATLDRLFAIDFVKAGYTNKSTRFMRRLLPHLIEGKMYSEACEIVGVKHSNSITREENASRLLLERLPSIANGTLRQPVVEKILNQAINLVNAIKEKYGAIDEVRVELARELKQSKEDRASTESAMSKLEKENEKYADAIQELGITPTRRRIRKMRLLHEAGYKCFYCGKDVTPIQFIEGHGYEVEHIIPRSRYFDDSFANNVCACRECNAAKGDKTAYEFMKAKSESEFNAYKERVISSNFSNRKKRYLMTDGHEIPTDFINRDLNETQYITRKMMEVLRDGFRNVRASSGLVTDFFRRVWGYDNVLHDLNFTKYAKADLVEEVEYETHGQIHKTLRIKDWSKRRDHRHHAVDALVVALTRQGYIQRLNTLNAMSGDDSLLDIGKKKLERWGAEQPHVPLHAVMAEVERIAVSFKGGMKFVTPGKRVKNKEGKVTRTMVPRAPLHKDTVYGEILVHDGKKKLKEALASPELIQDPTIREQLTSCLHRNGDDVKATLKELKKHPLMHREAPVDEVDCFRREIVVRYSISAITRKDIPSIVDTHIRKLISDRYDTVKSDKEFQASLSIEPIYSDTACTHKVKSVRCFTGNKPETLATVARNSEGKAIGFSQTRNNHHMAIYKKADGTLIPMVTSFWECVKRRRYGLPAIIKNPSEAWDHLLNLDANMDVEEIANGLPRPDYQFELSLQRNEMVVLGMTDDQWNDALATNDQAEINRHLYRVWKLAPKQYCFKYHTNTEAAIIEGDKETKAYYMLSSMNSLFALSPRKVYIDVLGNLIIDK